MTPAQLVDPKQSPGASYVFGTDTRGNKDWQTASSIVGSVGPSTQAFLVAASTWTWTHNFGFKPLVDAYDLSWNKIIADINHVDNNNLTATHLYNATGYLMAR